MSSSEQTRQNGLSITPRPERIYIEKSAAGQMIHCDFIVENLTAENWQIQQIELSVLDKVGKLSLRKFVNESGSIQTIPNRKLVGKTSALIFNPFFLFSHNIELQALHFRFTLVSTTNAEQENETETIVEVIIFPEPYDTKTSLNLPLKERALIWDGHDFYSHHRRFNYLQPMLQYFGFKSNFQRYAYDFVPINDDGEMFQGSYDNNEDWLGFGMPVYAVAGGRIADLSDGMRDNRTFDEMEIEVREMVVFGNYVIIDHQNGEYSCLAHLKQGSIAVKAGQEVQQGQLIGQIGASGSSLFPHLHYELRDGVGAKDVEGLPSYFHQFRQVLGTHSQDVVRGQIDTGDIIEG